MIIDLCPFYSELDLLELRLNQHTFADKFLIWEFTMDFQGETKPAHFALNMDRFAQFKDRIIYRQFDYLEGANPHEKAKHYRDIILPEIRQYNDTDIVINTDTDEIIRNLNDFDGGIMATELRFYVYYFNYFAGIWTNGCVCNVKDLKDKSLYDLRYNFNRHKYDTGLLSDCGWHFSWTGSHEVINDKYRNFGHAEGWTDKLLDAGYFEQIKEQGIKHWDNKLLRLVEIDKSFPIFVQQNTDKFKDYIR